MTRERELLIELSTKDMVSYYYPELINRIIELLAQPEQEPVAWITEWVQRYRYNGTPIIDRAVSFTKGDAPAVPNPNYIPLYTSPPKRKPLSDEEAHVLCQNRTLLGGTLLELLRDVEKAHGIGVDDE